MSGRKDILTNIVDKVESGEVSQEELTAHSSTLMYVNYFDVELRWLKYY